MNPRRFLPSSHTAGTGGRVGIVRRVRAAGFRAESFALAAIVVAAMLPLACNGCRSSQTPSGGGGGGATSGSASSSAEAQVADPGPPTLRLYFVSDMAGVVEPCGCSKDQLGGIDRFGAWVASERQGGRVPVSAVVAAGPLFFMDPTFKPDKTEQEQVKADTIARALSGLGFAAFAPGENDWAGGTQRLVALAKVSGGALVLADVVSDVPTAWRGTTVREMNGIKVGFVGVGTVGPGAGAPHADAGAVDAGAASGRHAALKTVALAESVKAGIAELKKDGAEVLILLASVGRGEAKRIADIAPELTAILVGSTSASGDANTVAPPAERVGNVLIAETANHLQTVAVLDLFVREAAREKGRAPLTFADASGLEQARKREELTRRIDDLRVKISNWETGGKVPRADIDARKADMARLQRERDQVDHRPPPPSGSFFRYTVKEIRDALGKDATVSGELLSYYKTVNDKNKIAFADRLPAPHSGDQATYVGAAACSSCHADAKKFWDSTPHAHAYATLSTQFKEFNLDCVSCHVTGYDMPGGSTVTHVDRLMDVQCEVCHGPGSKHGLKPSDKSLIVARPKPETCTSCHHPPHVEQFDANAKMADILGPGHGRAPKR